MNKTMRSEDTPLQLSNSVDLLQNRSRQVTDQSLQSTRLMVELVDKSKEVGICARQHLGEQGEKLNLLDENTKKIREELHESEKAITDLEKCCGICVLPWKIPYYSSRDNKAWKKSKEEKVVSVQPKRVKGDAFPDGIITRITNDASEEEMENNLSHVHSTVLDLKGIAADLRDEARAQNHHLDRIAQQADSNDQRVINAKKRTDQLHH